MMSFLLKLLGVRIENATRVADWSLAFRGGIHPGWVLLLAIGLAAGVVWLYRQAGEHVPAWRKYSMAGLRVLFLFLLLGLILRPVLAFSVEGSVRQSLVMLFDSSASMGIADPRTEDADVKRVALARSVLDPAKGLDQVLDVKQAGELAHLPRLELLKSALRNPQMDLVPRLAREYDLRPYTFGTELAEQPIIRLASEKPGEEKSYYLWVWALLVSAVAAVGVVWVYMRRTSAIPASAQARMNRHRWGLGVALVLLTALPLVTVAVEDALVRRLGWRTEKIMVQKQGAQEEAKTVPMEWVDQLQAKSVSTAGGDALRKVIADLSGQPVAGIFMAWDGANNTGLPALAAADLARQEEIPLFLYGVGISETKDIVVSNIFAPQTVFADEELPITVRVRSRGYKGQTATLNIELGNQVIEQEIALNDGEQVVPVKLTSPKIAPEKQVELDLKASIAPRPDETVKDNNSASHHLRIVDGKIHVLYVEQQPRWEFRYLQAMLLRDRRVDLKCVLMEADAGVAQVEGSPYLGKFPEEARELKDFNLIILGDVDPKNLSANQLEMIEQFVSKLGGGLLSIAGRKFMPQAYRKTPLDGLLPVEMETVDAGALGGGSRGEEAFEKPVRLELTAAGKETTMLRLSDKPAESEERWAKLPPVFWTARVAAPKPAAEVLLVDPDPAKASRFGKMPVVAIQQYGLGQSLFVGTDNTWRWRKNKGDEFYVTLWGQIVQRLTLPSLLGQGKLTQLTSDRQNYVAFERAAVFARLYDENLKPVETPSVRGFYKLPGQPDQPVELKPIASQKGMYRGEFVVLQPGTYRFWVERDPETKLDLVVGEPRIEFSETAMQEETLREMAKTSGGAFFREEDLFKLPSQVRLEAKKVRSPMEVELGFSPLWFITMVLAVGGEWVLRKVCQLK